MEYRSKLRPLREVQYAFDETPVTVKGLLTKEQGQPLFLRQVLHKAVQEYITSMRMVGAVVNTDIVMAAAKGIIAAREQSLLVQHGGHIELEKSLARSLERMGCVKQKSSNVWLVHMQSRTRRNLF